MRKNEPRVLPFACNAAAAMRREAEANASTVQLDGSRRHIPAKRRDAARRRPEAAPEPASAAKLVRSGMALVVLLVVGFGLWAAVAPLASAVVAAGVVKVGGDRREVEHLEGGILRQSLVVDGERVVPGQPLLLLDDARLATSRRLLEGKLLSALAREARLVAEKLDRKDIGFPPELVARQDADASKLMAAQIHQHNARRSALEGAFRVKDERIAQIREEMRANEAQLDASRRQLVYLQEEIGDLETLMSKGLMRKPRLLSMKRQHESLQGEVRQKQSLIARGQKEIGGILQEKLQLRLERHDEVSRELREAADEVFDARQRMATVDEQIGRLQVVAPIGGVVIGLGTKTPGAVVLAGERLLEIVPEGAELMIEARVPPSEIEGVRKGAVARVRITAFNARRTPVLIGRVEQVSADRLEQAAAGAAANGGGQTAPTQPYYKVMVRPPVANVAEAQALVPGMPAEVYIETRKLSLLDYLLSPLITGLDRAFHGQ